MLENAFLWENILLLGFQVFKTYSKALVRRIDASR